MSSYFGIGLMSGNSMDGLDVCYAEFMGVPQSDVWSYRIINSKIFEYEQQWQDRLKVAHHLTGLELLQLHTEFGHFVGRIVREYITDSGIAVDFVVFMGHLAFHQPDKQLTFSLGDGETIAAYLPCPLVTNLGAKDVALGGQGRPLICFGDQFLYQNNNFCLNLGGLAYISCFDQAFDVCPCNMLLNHIAHQMDPSVAFDVDGRRSGEGKLLPQLLAELNEIPYYSKPMPKALCREWFEAQVVPLLNKKGYAGIDLLHTAVAHIVHQIGVAVSKFPESERRTSVSRRTPRLSVVRRNVLITGGGARNRYMMAELTKMFESRQIDVAPVDDETVDFKEALITAFLGMRCLLGLTNVSKEMTGSVMDTISGSIHLPPNHNTPAAFMFQKQ